MKARLFSSCMTGICYPRVLDDARAVLGALGVEAAPLRGATCCGQAFMNSGHPEMAKKVGRGLFKSISESQEPAVMLSGSCAFFVREHHPRLFGAGADIAGRCFEFTEFLFKVLNADIKGSLKKPLRAAYHPSCHLLRGIKLKDEPFSILMGIEGLDLVRIEKEATCCGFGGVFSAIYPEVSERMAEEKVRAIREAGADAVVAADAGCMRRIERSGMRAVHIAEVLREAMAL